MKTQMKKLVIAIVMIVAFCGGVRGQNINDIPYEIAVKNDSNIWVAGNWKKINVPNNVSKFNFKDINVSGVGGDTIILKLVDTNVIYNNIPVKRWTINHSGIETIISETDTAYYILPKDSIKFTYIKAYYDTTYYDTTFISNKYVQIIMWSKFLPPVFELTDTINGAKNTNVNLTLADFGLTIEQSQGASLTAYYNTIKWYRDGLLIHEGTGLDTMYAVDSTGNYSVQVEVLYFTKSFIIGDTTTKAFSKWMFSDSVYVDMAIVNSYKDYISEKSTFNLYPNPTQNTITIEQPFSENTMISIFDITGQMVLQKKMESPVQQIDISSFPNGSYLIQVKSNDKTEFGKIIKL